MNGRPQTIAVALHDVEPATFERCALIREWLADHHIDRVTLLVIPARDLHPAGERSPQMIAWLKEREQAGDAIAQHGFQHLQVRLPPLPHRAVPWLRGGRAAEFAGLDAGETRRAVEAGWRVLKLAGVEPAGFVAPAYVYTPALRAALAERFRWWASLLHVHRMPTLSGLAAADLRAPAIGLGTSGPVRRALSPWSLRVGDAMSGEVLRLDLHPADLRYHRHMRALEAVLRRNGRQREAVTYDELLAA
jgi:predicted deacetylase